MVRDVSRSGHFNRPSKQMGYSPKNRKNTAFCVVFFAANPYNSRTFPCCTGVFVHWVAFLNPKGVNNETL